MHGEGYIQRLYIFLQCVTNLALVLQASMNIMKGIINIFEIIVVDIVNLFY